MPRIYTLAREQTIPTTLVKAWAFISSPANLDAITPPEMSFEIVSKVPEVMYNGLLIEYRVGIPFLGQQTWLTELKHIRENRSFVDEQRIGPYKIWYHYHEIREVEDGVRFTDQVTYVMPFGPLGDIVRRFYVKKQLEHIFNFRKQAMVELLTPPKT
jgi:ligand-binding SRPBCC domain-containing protein